MFSSEEYILPTKVCKTICSSVDSRCRAGPALIVNIIRWNGANFVESPEEKRYREQSRNIDYGRKSNVPCPNRRRTTFRDIGPGQVDVCIAKPERESNPVRVRAG